MYCPFCSHVETKVLESRLLTSSMRRRRECLKCENRFTTYEQAEFSLKVVKKDGKEEEYNLQKIAKSIEKACDKVETSIILSLSTKVHQRVLRKKTNPVKSVDIGRFVMQELKRFDKMAYLRFATIHKSIDDPKLLEKEINCLNTNSK